jgi:hypothetical protein
MTVSFLAVVQNDKFVWSALDDRFERGPGVRFACATREEQPQVLRLATLAQNDSQFFGGRSE